MGLYTTLILSGNSCFDKNFKKHLDIIPNKELRYEIWHTYNFYKPMTIICRAVLHKASNRGYPCSVPTSFKESFDVYKILIDIYRGNLGKVNYTALKPYIKDEEAYIKTKELLPAEAFRKLFNNQIRDFAATVAYVDRHAYHKFVSNAGGLFCYINNNERKYIQNTIFELDENTLNDIDCYCTNEINKVVDEIIKKAFAALYEEEEKEIEKRKAI